MANVHPHPAAHDHAHHHVHGGHPPAATGPSLLRMAAWQRLAGALGIVALLWLAVLWAVG